MHKTDKEKTKKDTCLHKRVKLFSKGPYRNAEFNKVLLDYKQCLDCNEVVWSEEIVLD